MVRKITILAICAVILIGFADGSRANAYSVYDGNFSNTYVTYFRDILAGESFASNYVAFRNGQNEYIMVVGDLDFTNDKFTLNESGTIYTFNIDGSYNANYTYSSNPITSFDLSVNNRIIYSDLGSFPQLLDRGEKYEMLNTLLLIVFMLGIVIHRLFVVR